MYITVPSGETIINNGNTVAWYDNDLTTITKDTNNYVTGWGDKLTYSEGAEMIDQDNWYKLSYWNTIGNNWSQVGTILHSDGSTGAANKLNFWTVGKTYKITVGINFTSGEIRPLNDNENSSRFFGPLGTYTFTYYITTTNTTLYNYSLSFLGDITAMSIKEVPNNTLVQSNFVNSVMPLHSGDGLLFDGINDFLKTGVFTLNQPEFIYAVIKPVSWVLYDYVFDGNTNNTGAIYQQSPNPGILATAGSGSPVNSNFTIGNFHILRVLFNGAQSKLIVDNTTPIVGNFGSANMSGFCLGKVGTAALYYGNIQVKEVIIRKAFDDKYIEGIIYNYLKKKYNL